MKDNGDVERLLAFLCLVAMIDVIVSGTFVVLKHFGMAEAGLFAGVVMFAFSVWLMRSIKE